MRGFRPHAGLAPTAGHFEEYCRGLLSDEPRKTVEPLALRAGTTVRTLQVFLKDAARDEQAMGATLRRKLAAAFAAEPDQSRLGTIGLIDETSVVKKGTKTPEGGPILKLFGEWLEHEHRIALPKSPFGQAVAYARNQWSTLGRYLADAQFTFDKKNRR